MFLNIWNTLNVAGWTLFLENGLLKFLSVSFKVNWCLTEIELILMAFHCEYLFRLDVSGPQGDHSSYFSWSKCKIFIHVFSFLSNLHIMEVLWNGNKFE